MAAVETKPKKKHPVLGFLLILGGLGLGGLILLGVGTAVWVHYYGDSFMASTKDLAEKGVEFGREHTADECVSETLGQVKDCAPINMKCTMSGQVFIQACLRAASPEESFCKDVPAPTEILDSISYRKDQCEHRGQSGREQCSQIMQGVQSYCEASRHESAPEN
jgi:hypothetical protein